MEKPRLKIYFIHSSNSDFNERIYLPVLRSEQLSHDELLFSSSEENKDKYYKDMIDRSNVCVVDLTDSDIYSKISLNVDSGITHTSWPSQFNSKTTPS